MRIVDLTTKSTRRDYAIENVMEEAFAVVIVDNLSLSTTALWEQQTATIAIGACGLSMSMRAKVIDDRVAMVV